MCLQVTSIFICYANFGMCQFVIANVIIWCDCGAFWMKSEFMSTIVNHIQQQITNKLFFITLICIVKHTCQLVTIGQLSIMTNMYIWMNKWMKIKLLSFNLFTSNDE